MNRFGEWLLYSFGVLIFLVVLIIVVVAFAALVVASINGDWVAGAVLLVISISMWIGRYVQKEESRKGVGKDER